MGRKRGKRLGNEMTERQRVIYEFIRDLVQRRGFGPTIREIADAFDIQSPNGVVCHLKALEKKGLIRRNEFKAERILQNRLFARLGAWAMLEDGALEAELRALGVEDAIDFRKARTLFEHFTAEKLATPAELARVACPVGVKIRSQSVPEIAVSIMAQFIDKRAELVYEKQGSPAAKFELIEWSDRNWVVKRLREW